MTTRSNPNRSSSYLSTASQAAIDTGSVRPRNRRLISTGDPASDPPPPPSNRSSGLLSAFSPSSSRASSPLSFGRPESNNGSSTNLGQFFNDSLTQSWTSVQELASSLLSTADGSTKGPRSSSRPAIWGRNSQTSNKSKASPSTWGPAPPTDHPQLHNIAAGSLADRDAALKAAKKASILESHDGVNGGLDVAGRHKRRTSDDLTPQHAPPEDILVYIHKVQSSDTYAGLILRFRCREDAFKKANGLWSRDAIQIRKWLMIPVDACEIRGRPCDPPSWHNSNTVDLLAPTPASTSNTASKLGTDDDYFGQLNKPEQTDEQEEDDKPWAHVRWVAVDGFREPVEIGRVSRQAIGYFPPRRKKSIRTISSLSTPRQSLDLSGTAPGSAEDRSSRRQSSLGNRPQLLGTPLSSRSRLGSDAGDTRPAWMKRPGGVGSMGRNVRAPGPEKDPLNTWTSKHLPGLNIDGPSMSIMGSETARFGFGRGTSEIVESSFEDGREVMSGSHSQQGTGLDKAAAAVETWLRGALARRPSTPLVAGLTRSPGRAQRTGQNDSIELVDTYSDDGRPAQDATTNLLDSLSLGSGSRSNGDGFVRERTTTAANKGRKDD
ncbi:hypothetical protein S40293_02887 [Stachybotrys chartarum IBT 40293]|nr:hypothetical protein S40293_02887 [Stachybotrys chartarum IBT 40293]